MDVSNQKILNKYNYENFNRYVIFNFNQKKRIAISEIEVKIENVRMFLRVQVLVLLKYLPSIFIVFVLRWIGAHERR